MDVTRRCGLRAILVAAPALFAAWASVARRSPSVPYGFLDIAVTPSVKAAQAKMGADHIWQDFKGHREFDRFTENEAAFIANRDSFYMATVSETDSSSKKIVILRPFGVVQ